MISFIVCIIIGVILIIIGVIFKIVSLKKNTTFERNKTNFKSMIPLIFWVSGGLVILFGAISPIM